MSSLQRGREFISTNAVIRASRKSEASETKMLELAVDITKPQLCSLPRASLHLCRVMPVLWRSVICGNGEPDLIWANPATPIPLRVHSFATILHLLGAASMYMSKQGVTQVDGTSKWNVVTLGRVLALQFDEAKLFGDQAKEVFDPAAWGSHAEMEAVSEKVLHKRSHVRRNYDLFNDMPTRDGDAISPTTLPESTGANSPPTKVSVVTTTPIPTNKAASDDYLLGAIPTLGFEQLTPESSPTKTRDVKIDSKTDFQSALRAAELDNDIDRPEGDGAAAAKAMIQAFSGNITGSKRWMTAPSPALSTIRETEDSDDLEDLAGSVVPSRIPVQEMDILDQEFSLNAVKRPVKRMRVPNLKSTTLNMATVSKPLDAKDTTPVFSSNTVPKSDDIEKVATPFLDIIGESLGLRYVIAIAVVRVNYLLLLLPFLVLTLIPFNSAALAPTTCMARPGVWDLPITARHAVDPVSTGLYGRATVAWAIPSPRLLNPWKQKILLTISTKVCRVCGKRSLPAPVFQTLSTD